MGRALGAAHYGGCLSCVEILYAIYRDIDRSAIQASDPARPFVLLSKGHAALTLYAVLEHFFGWRFDADGSVDSISCHPLRRTDRGIEAIAGSLGHGLAIGCGRALWCRRNAHRSLTYVVMGDGECQEGSVWEAALFAGHYGLSNLFVVIDRNGFQQRAATTDRSRYAASPNAWSAIGWDVHSVDGHDVERLSVALSPERSDDRPRVIFADTVKGRGVSTLEGELGSHYRAVPDDLLQSAIADIDGGFR